MNWSGKLTEALSGLRRDPLEALRLLRMGLATARFRYLLRVAGPGCVFGTNNRIINAANVAIGRSCLFQDSIYIRAGVHGRISIGDGVALNSFVQLYGHGGITLGDETQIGPGTIVTTTGHDYTDRKLEAHFEPVLIGKRVWIGANATIIGGVTIGDGAVIGAGAVVIRDIPPHSLAVGVPARVVRRLEGGDQIDNASHSIIGPAPSPRREPPLQCDSGGK
jgi:acetyltransferase-like isoleucine patch superfamily enzyme